MRFRHDWADEHWDMVALGWKANLTNIQAPQRAQAMSKLTYKRCPARPPEPKARAA